MAERKPMFMTADGWSEEMAAADTAAFGGLTLSGAIAMATNKITGLGNPINPQDAATKYYVDSIATGLDFKDSVRVGTVAPLPTCTAAGTGIGKTLTATAVGILTVDGKDLVLNNRLLVKNQATGSDNGVYTVTTEGTVGVAFVLTRSSDADQTAEITAGMFTFIEEGDTLQDTGWVLATNNPITVDTTALLFTQFSAAGVFTFEQGLLLSGAAVSIELNTAADAQGAGAAGGSSGLEFDANTSSGKLRAAVNATGGLERTASGLAAKLNGTTLQSAAGGLSVKGLPTSFEINGSAVSANFTATNAGYLVDGASADAVHFHASAKASVAVDEAVSVADPLVAGTTNDRVQKGRGDTNAKSYVLGIAETAQAAVGANARMVLRGPAAGVLSGATIGDRYYMAATGGLTAANTPPGAGNRVILVGIAKNATDMWVNITDFGRKAA